MHIHATYIHVPETATVVWLIYVLSTGLVDIKQQKVPAVLKTCWFLLLLLFCVVFDTFDFVKILQGTTQ